ARDCWARLACGKGLAVFAAQSTFSVTVICHMTPERHRRVVELFEQLCDYGSNQQETLLTVLCHGDDELRHAVEAMLAADRGSSRFLETPPDDFAAALVMNSQFQPLGGQLFGDYE